jgi:Ca2+-binding RTX toxin-like protein
VIPGGGTGGTDTGVAPGGGTGVPAVPAPGAQPARIGTGLADVQTGTPGADQVFGLGGNDNIDAGDGADYVDGGLGDDLIAGRDGADTLLGAEGDDILDGGTGNDILYGQEGDDRLFGTQGDDILFGGAGSDALFGGDGGDILSGGDGADLLAGDDGDDVLDGQAGTDRLFDGLGRDVVSGGEGDDWVSVAADADEDSFFGNAGFDVLDLSAAEAGLTIDLAGQTVTGPAAPDRFDGFEQITGGAGEDLFLAGGQGMTLAGGAGADVFDFSLVPGVIPGQQMAFFRITDFQAGDMLKLPGNLTLASLSGTGGLFGLTQAEPTLASQMGPAQDYTQDSGAARLRFATEASDSLVHTVITADVDNDGAWDFEVSIDGWVPSDAVPQDFHLTQPLQQ